MPFGAWHPYVVPSCRLDGDEVFPYQQKTGTPVYCPLPADVAKKRNAVENENERYFFYDGTSQPESMVKGGRPMGR